MSNTELCRLCAVLAEDTNSQKLFGTSQQNLRRQIEELIGFRLQNAKDLPQQICKPCEEQTQQAHQFRERCIRMQQQLTSMLKKKKTRQKKRQLKNAQKADKVVYPIEKVILPEIEQVKTEQLEDGEKPRLQPSLEALLKLEPPMSNAADSSNDSFVADVEYHRASSDDAQDTQHFDTVDVQPHIANEKCKLEEASQDKTTAYQLPEENQTIGGTKRIQKQRQDLDANEEPTEKRDPKERRAPRKKQICICDLCGISFASPFNLEIHQRRHVGDKQYQCTFCPERCYTKWSLDRHIRRHTGELPFQCRYCERRFIDHYPRIRHERTHTKVRPFACTQCEKTFGVADTLKNHMLTHTGHRSFHCNVCDRMFLRRTHLITHYRSITHKQNEEKLKPLLESQDDSVVAASQQLEFPLAV